MSELEKPSSDDNAAAAGIALIVAFCCLIGVMCFAMGFIVRGC